MLKKIDSFVDRNVPKLSIGLTIGAAFISGVMLTLGVIELNIVTLIGSILSMVLAIFYGLISYYSTRSELLDELMENYGNKSNKNN